MQGKRRERSRRSHPVQLPPQSAEEQCDRSRPRQTEDWTGRLRAEGLLGAQEGVTTTTTPTPQNKSKTRPQHRPGAPSHWGAFCFRNKTPRTRRARRQTLPTRSRPSAAVSLLPEARTSPDPGSVGGSPRVRSTRLRHTALPCTRGRGREPTPTP